MDKPLEKDIETAIDEEISCPEPREILHQQQCKQEKLKNIFMMSERSKPYETMHALSLGMKGTVIRENKQQRVEHMRLPWS